MSVVSAVEYARNAARVSPAARSRDHLRRPGAQRRALLQAAGRGAGPAARVLVTASSPHLGAAARAALPPPLGRAARASPPPAPKRPTSTRCDGLPHEAVLVIGDAALHARGASARYPVRVRPGRGVEGRGPACRSCSRSGPRAATRGPARCRRCTAACSSRATGGLAHLDELARRRSRRTGVAERGLPRVSRRPRLRAVVPPPRRPDRFLPPAGAGRAGAGRLALVHLGCVARSELII